jgi:hypothetical protein
LLRGEFLAKKTASKKSKPVRKIASKPKVDLSEKKSEPIEKIKSEPKKTGFNSKRLLYVVLVVAVICVIVVVAWFFLRSDVVEAQLIIESGDVQVKHGDDSWDWVTAQNGMLLYQSDAVRTGENSSASIVFFESSIVRLDSNTEVTLREILLESGKTSVKIQQDAGRTWNTVLKVSGIDDYEVQTPSTVASVRGTSFDVYIRFENETDVGVGRGIVVVSKIVDDEVVDSIELNMNDAVTVFHDVFDQILKIKEFLFDDWILKNQEKDGGFISDVKEDLYERMDPYISQIKERWGVTDDELDVLVEGYIKGNFDLPPDTPDWIVNLMELT